MLVIHINLSTRMRPGGVAKLRAYLQSMEVKAESVQKDANVAIRKVTWRDVREAKDSRCARAWREARCTVAPELSLEFDECNGPLPDINGVPCASVFAR